MKTKFNLLLLLITVALFIESCSPSLTGTKALTNLKKLPVNIIDRDQDGVLDLDDSLTVNQIPQIITQIPTKRSDLESMKSAVKVYDGKANFGITIPGFGGLKLGKDESNLNVYYIERKAINKNGKTEIYGCGYSVHYLFKKVQKGISVDNLANVAASAQLNSSKTQVFYSIQSYGITGSSLIKYFKPVVNKNFNVEGFGIMQASIDGIHSILSDDELSQKLKFTPELIDELSVNDF